jgi:hypothetical protein
LVSSSTAADIDLMVPSARAATLERVDYVCGDQLSKGMCRVLGYVLTGVIVAGDNGGTRQRSR